MILLNKFNQSINQCLGIEMRSVTHNWLNILCPMGKAKIRLGPNDGFVKYCESHYTIIGLGST